MKRYILGICTLALAIGMSAFTAPQKTSALAAKWFQLSPSGTSTNPNDYSLSGSQPCDGQSTIVCGVFAQEDPNNLGHPILDEEADYVYREQ
jgi:hypothetical protein